MSEQRFAEVTWERRWNESTQAAALSQNGHEVALVTSLGIVHFDLREFDSINAFIGQMEAALQLLAATKVRYDQVWGKRK